MPRKKTNTELPQDVLPTGGFDLMDALGGMAEDLAMDTTEAMLAAMDFEKALLNIAQSIAAQAIRVGESEDEAERVKAAERQVKLIGKLFKQLEVATQAPPR